MSFIAESAERLLSRLYQTFSVPLAFAHPRDGLSITIPGIDKTSGAPISLHEIQIGTVRPCATVRIKDLRANDVDYADMEGVNITLNGEEWFVVSVKLASGPSGEAGGEAYLMLSSLANI
jgi:hypothetical protein